MFINSKDAPFAVGYVWAVYYLLRVCHELPRVSWKTAVKLGLAIGLTMAIRVGGLILLCYLFLFVGVWFLHFLWQNRSALRAALPIVFRALLFAVGIAAIAYVTMLLFWPHALSKPLVRPFMTLHWLAHIGGGTSEPDYVPRYLLFKVPELTLMLICVGIFLGVRALLKRTSFQTVLPYSILIFVVAFPVIYASLTRPSLYDEIRHFLFLVPPISCLAGITLSRILSLPAERPTNFRVPLWRKVFVAALALYFIFHIRLLVQLHPYEYAYYNRLIGGVYGANQRHYPTEYWATSYKEGERKLEAYLRERDGANFEKTQYKIFGGDAIWCAAYYFPPNFVAVPAAPGADVYLTTTRYGALTFPGEKQILDVERFGVPFLVGKILDKGNQ